MHLILLKFLSGARRTSERMATISNEVVDSLPGQYPHFHDYERLREQCLSAMSEVKTLRSSFEKESRERESLKQQNLRKFPAGKIAKK